MPHRKKSTWDKFRNDADTLMNSAMQATAEFVCEARDKLKNAADEIEDSVRETVSDASREHVQDFIDKTEKAAETGIEILGRAGYNAMTGIARNTVSLGISGIKVADHLVHGEVAKAGDILIDRAKRSVGGIISAGSAATDLIEQGYEAFVHDSPLATKANEEKLTQVLSVVFLASICAWELTPDTPEGLACGLTTDSDIPGVENGVFVGSDEELQGLIQMGENPNTVHIPSDEVSRSMTVRNEFLRMHGFESCPENYQVHHIFPLSEGGEDAVTNMVLIDNESHATITAAHDDYYQWGHKINV